MTENTIVSETIVNLEEQFNSLSPTQRGFVEEYLTNGYNATNAAMAVAKKQDKSNLSFRVEGCRYLQLPEIAEYIKSYFKTLRSQHESDLNRYIDELNRLAYSEPHNRDAHTAKLKALELLYKVYYGNEKKSVSITDNTGNVIRVEYV